MANEEGPLFLLDDAVVLHNLHMNAAEDAAKACGGVQSIQHDIVNSYDTGDTFIVSKGKVGEIGIIKKFEDFSGMDSLRSEKLTSKLKSQIFDGMKAYLTAFADSSVANSLKIDDLVMFIPNQYGRNVKSTAKERTSKDTRLMSMPDEDFTKFQKEHPKDKPVIGYKIQFQLV